MKNNKLNLKSLKVESFVTNLTTEKSLTLKGGATYDGPSFCTGPGRLIIVGVYVTKQSSRK